ncbi:hypothetical protein M9H77_26820 [Catharanthus roseus]|uniref:Uncharacterized protein n=1 Tax=Catharanthus roseus TaxID=4058 RepID=A0ACC0AC70_CATRO|nr:hypothetical protein M9H77_26820 [Catharanthus roseus]
MLQSRPTKYGRSSLFSFSFCCGRDLPSTELPLTIGWPTSCVRTPLLSYQSYLIKLFSKEDGRKTWKFGTFVYVDWEVEEFVELKEISCKAKLIFIGKRFEDESFPERGYDMNQQRIIQQIPEEQLEKAWMRLQWRNYGVN